MNHELAIRALRAHNISYRLNGSDLEVLDEYTKDGCYCSIWIPCPPTMNDIANWLGY